MDRLVSVDAKEVEIEYRRSQRCSSSLRVTNVMHTMTVAVHLSTTRPALYSFQPAAVAFLPPLASSAFSLVLSATASPPLASPPDSILVRSALLPTGRADAAALLRLFSRPGVHVFRDATVPISLTGPHVLDALLHSSDALETAFLLSRALPACSPSDLSALLLRAAAAGDSCFVSTLLAAGADPHARADDGSRSPLALAVVSGSDEAVAVLLHAGAQPYRGLMHEAAALNRTDMMRLLAGATDDPAWGDAADWRGRTPLHVAAESGHVEAARLCITAGGADPDRVDERGWTPLHCAAAGGHLAAAEFLLESSRYNAKRALTKDGRLTPYDLAAERGHERLYDALRLGDELHRAARAGNVSAARACLMRGAVPACGDQHGWTPLHRAAFKGRIEVARVLIEHGALLDAADDAGYTPLRCAVEAGHADMALCLIAHGAARAGLKGMNINTMRSANCLPSKLKVGSCGGAAALGEDSQVIET